MAEYIALKDFDPKNLTFGSVIKKTYQKGKVAGTYHIINFFYKGQPLTVDCGFPFNTNGVEKSDFDKKSPKPRVEKKENDEESNGFTVKLFVPQTEKGAVFEKFIHNLYIATGLEFARIAKSSFNLTTVTKEITTWQDFYRHPLFNHDGGTKSLITKLIYNTVPIYVDGADKPPKIEYRFDTELAQFKASSVHVSSVDVKTKTVNPFTVKKKFELSHKIDPLDKSSKLPCKMLPIIRFSGLYIGESETGLYVRMRVNLWSASVLPKQNKTLTLQKQMDAYAESIPEDDPIFDMVSDRGSEQDEHLTPNSPDEHAQDVYQ
jgi:hypothetical protein